MRQSWRGHLTRIGREGIGIRPEGAPCRLPTPFGGAEEEDVDVAVEEAPVVGASVGGSILIRGRLLTASYARSHTTVAKCAMMGNLAGLELELREDKNCANEIDISGNSPMTLAALHGQGDAIRLLAQYGADADYQDQKGWSAAHCAVIGKGGSPDILATLFNLGAAVDLADKTGSTPAHHAATMNKLGCLKTLALFAPHTLGAAAHNGFTPLHRAAQAGSHRAVELLLRLGVDINALDRMRESAAHKAGRLSNGEAFDVLRSFGANMHAPNLDDDTAASLPVAQSVPFMNAVDPQELASVRYNNDPLKEVAAMLHEQQIFMRRKQAFAMRDAMNAVAMRAEVRAKIQDEAAAFRASRMLLGPRYENRMQLEAEAARKREAKKAHAIKRQKLLVARQHKQQKAESIAIKHARQEAKAARKQQRESGALALASSPITVKR